MKQENQNAYEIIYNRMQPVIDIDTTNNEVIQLSGNCDFCLRCATETDGMGIVWLDSYKTRNHICKSCNIFVEQLPNVLGYERGAVGYKLSSFKGGYLAIPVDKNKQVELWIGGKYLDRVNFDSGLKIVDITGNAAKYEMCERIGDYAVVTEVSLRREMFLRHVRKSDSNNLFISTETGVIAINKHDYQELKGALQDESLNSKQLIETVSMLNGIKTGRISITSKTSQALLGGLSKRLLSAIKQVADPSCVLYMLAGLKVGLAKNEVKK